MSSNWSALHAQLVRSVNLHANLSVFRTLARGHPALSRFRDPTELFDWLHRDGPAADAKNDGLAALLCATKAEGRVGDHAVELLILALWPGLDAVRSRLRRYYRSEIDLLDGEAVGRLAAGIRRADPATTRRVAATLLRNVERDLRRVRMAEVARRECPIDHLAAATCVATVAPASLPPALLVRDLRRLAGNDGLVFVFADLLGLSQHEVARLLDCSYEAARKRMQRVRRQLQVTWC